jgi:GNAT superfamily N-acetyltransferase
MVQLRVIGPDDWADWRRIRLRALAESPAAFGSTLAREQGYDESEWRDRADGSVLVYDDGVPVAMGAGFADDRPGHLMVVAMWTEPARRGEGLGGLVLDAVVAGALERGLVPHLFVMEANPEVGRLYRRHGFVASGLVEEHGGRPAAELVYGQGQAEP